jgi:hypothetical protein
MIKCRLSLFKRLMEIIVGGELEYQTSWAVCHSLDARGQGIMSLHLTV